ncbi:MAG: DUF5104 domain-containing protein [Oscillospiraceae bacterium]|nr:DUF5104 domain-containing protein [Oscillospiraceae bacterium]
MNIKSSSLLILLLLILFCAAILTGCANLKISMGLVQHAVGGLYDPTDQIAEDQLNAILETAVAQDVAAIKAQFAPNAIAAQPELDDQIEALLDYYAEKSWEIDSPGCMTMDSSNADGTGGRVSSFQMHGMILTDRFYRFSLRGISVDTKNPDNVGIWALFLLQVDQPTDYAYCVAGEDDMVGIYVDLPAEQFDYEVTE